jgi:hypothetical protein
MSWQIYVGGNPKRWHWTLKDDASGNVLKQSECGFGTFYVCVQDAIAHGLESAAAATISPRTTDQKTCE